MTISPRWPGANKAPSGLWIATSGPAPTPQPRDMEQRHEDEAGAGSLEAQPPADIARRGRQIAMGQGPDLGPRGGPGGVQPQRPLLGPAMPAPTQPAGGNRLPAPEQAI